MLIMPKRYPVEQRERATRMALDRVGEYGSAWAVAQALGPKLGVGPETLRKWVVQAQVDRVRCVQRDVAEVGPGGSAGHMASASSVNAAVRR
jgi:transposase-like protein